METQSITSSARFLMHRREMVHPAEVHLPPRCLITFSQHYYGLLRPYRPIRRMAWIHPAYPYVLFKHHDRPLALIVSPMGAPMAGMILDETIHLGGEEILFWGTCGIFDPDFQNRIILIEGAIIDEGTSRHYCHETYSKPDGTLVADLEAFFKARSLPFSKGWVWSTDAPYRIPPTKREEMIRRHCLAVDMESAVLFSIASFYQKKIAGFLVPSDLILDDAWEFFSSPQRPPFLKASSLLEMAISFFSRAEKSCIGRVN